VVTALRPPYVGNVATLTTSYRDAAVTLWGDAGAHAHDAYARLRPALYPELPPQVPIVIGITAYGRCLGLTRHGWEHGPRITLESRRFAEGARLIDDVIAHEMLHAWLAVTGRGAKHDSADWYEAIRRLSPAVLGRELDARRGGARRSVRVPNPAYVPGGSEPKTLVRKQDVAGAVPHAAVACWPQAFRPDDYDWGTPIPCPTY